MPRRAPKGIHVVQKSRVGFRHMRRGANTDPGATQVLDDWWVPQRNVHRKEGLEGDQGVTKGTYEDKLREEAGSELVLPNSVGSDGVLHRRRFEVLSPAFPDYHPGDEWIEITRNDDDDPVYVGTPLGGTLRRGELGVRLVDAWWMQRKERETGAGFWCNAPRDVWEHYAGVWTAVAASDFRLDGQFSMGINATSPDGAWDSSYVEHYGDDAVRIRPLSGSGYLQAIDDAIATTDRHWRFEIECVLSNAAATVVIGLAGPSAGSPQFFAHMTAGSLLLQTPSGIFAAAAPPLKANTPMSLALERRDRRLFLYIDGDLAGCFPASDAANPVYPGALINGGNLIVTSLFCKKWRPWLLRGSYRGDPRVPGNPVAGGLIGDYFDERPVSTITSPNPEMLLAPTLSPSGRRQDDVLDFYDDATPGAPWIPHGQRQHFSTRWTGSVYLDLESSDYSLRVRVDDRARIYIGKTRGGEHYLSDWTAAGHALAYTTGGSLRTHLADAENPVPKSGWYPIIVEYSTGTGGAGIQLQIRQGTTGNGWRNVNGGRYLWEVLADAPVLVAPLDQRAFDGATSDRSTNGATGTAVGVTAIVEGPIPGHVAHDFNGTTAYISYPDAGALDASTAVTVEAWANPDTVAAGNRRWVSKDLAYVLRQDGADLKGSVYVNGAYRVHAIVGGVIAGEWHLYAMRAFRCTGAGAPSASGTFWRIELLRDGVLLSGTTISTGGFNINNSAAVVAIGNTVGAGGAEWYDGKLAYPAVYTVAHGDGRLLAHYEARYDRTGSGRTSPLGIFQDHIRHDSHYAVLERLVNDFGYQAKLEPKALESGEFPGRLVPRHRVGRDTEITITENDATDIGRDVNAEDVADHLVADAAGLGTEDAAQVTVDAVNFDAVRDHPFLISEGEALPEITFEANVRQRLDSLLVLRGTPWEEVGGQPSQQQRLADTFELTGQLALFRWGAGDGVRYVFESLDVEDLEPRQLAQIAWSFVQDGFGAPSVSSRQRPRRMRDLVTRLQRLAHGQHRNFQGQLVVVHGTYGSTNAGIAPEPYTRLFLPTTHRVKKVELVVQSKSDASSKTLEINGGATTKTITANGIYDVTPFASQVGVTDEMYARLTGGTGAHNIQLRAHVAH